MKISSIYAREILDSRGNPTVEAQVILDSGFVGKAAVPSGASTGSHEAVELRDGGKRYGGLGVSKAVANIYEKIAPVVTKSSFDSLSALDATMIELDGTPSKSRLGANAILAVSLAAARARSAEEGLELYVYLRQEYGFQFSNFSLPVATMNVLNGGVHAGWTIDFQECMIVPQAESFRERVRIGSEVFHALKGILNAEGFVGGVGDEGGFAPHLASNETALKYITKAIESAGYQPGMDVAMALDPASSEFFDTKTKEYSLRTDAKKYTSKEMIDMWKTLAHTYPIISIEDGLAEDDWDNWQHLTQELGKEIVLVGDDLFVTNTERLRAGIERNVANAVLIKVNQIGTLSETMATIKLAQKHAYKVSISHRSGETADTFIADLAVAVNADFIKAGSLSRSERVEKYNRLMEIEGALMI